MNTQEQVAAQNIDVLIVNCLRFKRKLSSDMIIRGIRYESEDLQMLLLMHEMLLHMIVWLLDEQMLLDTEVYGHQRHFEDTDSFPF